jgi:colanic acid/amylovoran biosynthesis glycosyltransferase
VKVSPFISVDAASSPSETDVALATEAQADLPGVLIYTPHLLSTVQHYVREHAVRLRRYRPVLAGRRRVEGTRVDDFPTFTFETGHISPYERLYRRRLPRLLRQSTEVISVSRSWRDRIVMLGCPPEKVRTNYLGVDSTFFDGARSQFDPLSIIFVGRLVRRKGAHILLEGLRLLHGRGVDARLTIVGEGPESDQLKRTAAEKSLPVRFLGRRSPAEIRELLRQAAVLCAPSTTAGGEVPEALGLVLLEAQAMSVPVVATRNGGIPETLEDGRTGYLVDEESPAALAGALETLLGNEPLNRSFGQRARAFVCERFDIDQCYRALEDLYDGL